MTFEEFMTECDAICVSEIGVGVHDMPDLMWRDFFDDGMSPQDSIDCAMEEWGMNITQEEWEMNGEW
jgi:hypothetical protein